MKPALCLRIAQGPTGTKRPHHQMRYNCISEGSISVSTVYGICKITWSTVHVHSLCLKCLPQVLCSKASSPDRTLYCTAAIAVNSVKPYHNAFHTFVPVGRSSTALQVVKRLELTNTQRLKAKSGQIRSNFLDRHKTQTHSPLSRNDLQPSLVHFH